MDGSGDLAGGSKAGFPGLHGLWNANLRARILAALVMLPPVIYAVWQGGWWFFALLVTASALMSFEWNRMTGQAVILPTAIATTLCALLVSAAELLSEIGDARAHLLVLMGIAFMLVVGAVLSGYVPDEEEEHVRKSWRWGLLGTVYTAAAVFSLAWLRALDEHGLFVFWLFLSIWAMDVGGYFAGRIVGGAKLWPRVSPSKTWAGLAGGVLLSGAVSALYSLVFGFWDPQPLALVGMLIAAVGQAGDLFESWVKRRFKTKDSSHLIPGHGGILDRVDGIVFAAPFAVTILSGMLVWRGDIL